MKNVLRFSVIFVCLSLIAGAALFGQQSYRFEAAGYRVQTDSEGFQKILLEGFFSYGVPGYPDLPSKILLIAVPPDADLNTISLSPSEKAGRSIGRFNIREIPALETYADGQHRSGEKADCYTRDAYFPQKSVEFLGSSQMRKWKILRVKYTPFRYNPVTQDLLYIPEAGLRIGYARHG
jgi:hypothetical protein